jgi:ATP-dependent RNA helicase RhlE
MKATAATQPGGFASLGLSETLVAAVTALGYEEPTPIQREAIPVLLSGRDMLGQAATGTGKTAAFALPLLQGLAEAAGGRQPLPPRAARILVLVPTRELALQVAESFAEYGRYVPHSRAVVLGGVSQNSQVHALARGVDVLVATPGRLLDLCQQKLARLDRVQALVLDEADRMLDLGFLPDVKRIVAMVPAKRQTLLFSATMPDNIRTLASRVLHDPVEVAVAPVSSTAEGVTQYVLFVGHKDKRHLLAEVLRDPAMTRALVFTRTKRGANRVAEHLEKSRVSVGVIHGNKSQNARVRALEAFKDGKARVLVATDIAARGIDVQDVTHVINYELPDDPESYVHRIGRTARAGRRGVALSFCDASERTSLRDIERLTGQRIRIVEQHPYSGANRGGLQ